jgi:iron complex outermembrane recepter protein
VNGVISIITKPAKETRGMTVEAGGGNLDQGFGMARYGGDLGGRTQYRLYTKYSNQVQLQEASGLNAGDGWHVLRGGFRSDTQISSQDTITLQGDIYSGTEGSPSLFLPSLTSPGLVPEERRINLSGGFFGAQWEHRYREGSEMNVTFNYNASARQDVLHERVRSFDLEFRDRLAVGSRQDVVWGVEYHPSFVAQPRGVVLVFDSGR